MKGECCVCRVFFLRLQMTPLLKILKASSQWTEFTAIFAVTTWGRRFSNALTAGPSCVSSQNPQDLGAFGCLHRPGSKNFDALCANRDIGGGPTARRKGQMEAFR